jgi:DNA-binding response OmpR family regulator
MGRFENHSVLVVDDDIESLESMSEYLEIDFSTVYRASSAKDALVLVAKKRPDLVFTDIVMPKYDGFYLIEQMGLMGLNIPIVIVSAYNDKEKLLKAIKADIVDYLIKPLTSPKLKETMQLCMKKLEKNGVKISLQDGFVWDKKREILLKKDKILKLTKSETKVMQMLVGNIDSPVASIDIFYTLCDFEHKEFNPKNIRNIIYKLRKKIGSRSLIENIYGSKYILRGAR